MATHDEQDVRQRGQSRTPYRRVTSNTTTVQPTKASLEAFAPALMLGTTMAGTGAAAGAATGPAAPVAVPALVTLASIAGTGYGVYKNWDLLKTIGAAEMARAKNNIGRVYNTLSSYFYPDEAPATGGETTAGTTARNDSTDTPTPAPPAPAPDPQPDNNNNNNNNEDKNKKTFVEKWVKPFSGYKGGSWVGNAARAYRDMLTTVGGAMAGDQLVPIPFELAARYITDSPVQHKGVTGWARQWIDGSSPNGTQNDMQLRQVVLPDGTRAYLTPGDSLPEERTTNIPIVTNQQPDSSAIWQFSDL